MYNAYRPTMNGLIFQNNSAIYGPNIGSYAIKLNFRGMDYSLNISMSNIASGQILNEILSFELKDYDNQTLKTDSRSTLTIKSNSPNSNAVDNLAKFEEGVATFDSLIFISEPGSNSNSFRLTTTGIDLESARKQLGSEYELQQIILDFRFCKPGEMIYSNI